MSVDLWVQRVATTDDAEEIAALMRASVLALFPGYYDERQTASAAVHIAHVDQALLADGTYFVHEIDGQIVACGGWSRRGRLYMGSSTQDGDDRLLDRAPRRPTSGRCSCTATGPGEGLDAPSSNRAVTPPTPKAFRCLTSWRRCQACRSTGHSGSVKSNLPSSPCPTA